MTSEHDFISLPFCPSDDSTLSAAAEPAAVETDATPLPGSQSADKDALLKGEAQEEPRLVVNQQSSAAVEISEIALNVGASVAEWEELVPVAQAEGETLAAAAPPAPVDAGKGGAPAHTTDDKKMLQLADVFITRVAGGRQQEKAAVPSARTIWKQQQQMADGKRKASPVATARALSKERGPGAPTVVVVPTQQRATITWSADVGAPKQAVVVTHVLRGGGSEYDSDRKKATGFFKALFKGCLAPRAKQWETVVAPQ